MYTLAIILSIVSSILLIIYLLGLIFGSRKIDKDLNVTISGRIITTTITETRIVNAPNDERVIEGESLSGRPLNSKTYKD